SYLPVSVSWLPATSPAPEAVICAAPTTRGRVSVQRKRPSSAYILSVTGTEPGGVLNSARPCQTPTNPASSGGAGCARSGGRAGSGCALAFTDSSLPRSTVATAPANPSSTSSTRVIAP